MKLSLSISLVFVFAISTFAQDIDIKKFDYRKADSIAVNFPKKKYKNISEITKPLTEGLNTDHEKFRAIFRWITENIEYNKSAGSLAESDKIIRKNKAVCQGFSNLLKEMCESVNIPCNVVVGYTKTEPRDINRKLKKTDHAWNTVKLYDKEYLVDVTWATSKYNVFNRRFVKEFDEYYFLTPPEKFILDHFPKEKKYQLLEKLHKAKQFISAPIYYTDYFHLDVQSLSPAKGKFTHKLKKPLLVKFTCGTEITSAAVYTPLDKFVVPVELKKGKLPNEYFFEYLFEKEGHFDLTIYFNGLCIADYVIRVK
ncbi:MAG: transglutaminase domain-containing protein [Bacteroidia bacterium]